MSGILGPEIDTLATVMDILRVHLSEEHEAWKSVHLARNILRHDDWLARNIRRARTANASWNDSEVATTANIMLNCALRCIDPATECGQLTRPRIERVIEMLDVFGDMQAASEILGHLAQARGY